MHLLIAVLNTRRLVYTLLDAAKIFSYKIQSREFNKQIENCIFFYVRFSCTLNIYQNGKKTWE